MARGRIIVQEISYDKRLFEQLTERQAFIFLCCIPHTDTNGDLPGDPAVLRLKCLPAAKYNDHEVSNAIEAWLKTDPPIAATIKDDFGKVRLRFLDFESCNEGLDFLRRRRLRNVSRTVPDSPGQSHKFSDMKGSEEKRSKDKSTDTEPRFKGPPWKNPKSQGAYRLAAIMWHLRQDRSLENDPWVEDEVWSIKGSQFKARYCRIAKQIIAFFSGSLETATNCVVDKCAEYEDKGFAGWKVENILQDAPGWRAKNVQPNA